MESVEVIKTYEETHALLKGHFRLSSGRHSDRYLQSALVLQYPWVAEKLCWALAELVKPLNPHAILSPALGGVIVGQELARILRVKAMFTERNKETDAMELRRGFRIENGDRIFAVEDVITTGKSVKESIEVARSLGAQVVGVGCLIDRSDKQAHFDVPLKALACLTVSNWEESECPLCLQGSPVTKPGSRTKF